MKANKPSSPDSGEPDKKFRIGAVSKITQIPVDTIRAWERRYGVVSPVRNMSSTRLFSLSDIERLQLIKRLVDAGHSIGSIAALESAELTKRLELHESDPANRLPPRHEISSLLVYNEPEAHFINFDETSPNSVKEFRVFEQWNEFETEIRAKRPNAILLQLATILDPQLTRISRLVGRLDDTTVVVVYGFAANTLVERLSRSGVTCLRAPINFDQLLIALQLRPSSTPENVMPLETNARRLFDDDTLKSIAQVSAKVQCECPHHLVDIVKTLMQFELYSAECESRNAADAALHASLATTTAKARSLFEYALVKVAKYEGIALPQRLLDSVNPGSED